MRFSLALVLVSSGLTLAWSQTGITTNATSNVVSVPTVGIEQPQPERLRISAGEVVYDSGPLRTRPNQPTVIEVLPTVAFSGFLGAIPFVGDDLTLSGSGVLSEMTFTVANLGFQGLDQGAINGIDYEVYFQLPVDPNLVTGSEPNYPVDLFPIPGNSSFTGTLDLSNPDGDPNTPDDNPLVFEAIQTVELTGLEVHNITLPKDVRVIILFRDIRINGSSAFLVVLGNALSQARADVGFSDDYHFADAIDNPSGYVFQQSQFRINSSPSMTLSVVETLEENLEVPRLVYHAVLGEREGDGESTLRAGRYDPFTEIAGNEFEADAFGPIKQFRYSLGNLTQDPNDPDNPAATYSINSWSQTFWVFDRSPDPNSPGDELWTLVDRFTHTFDWEARTGAPLFHLGFTVNLVVNDPVSDIDPNRAPETIGNSVGILQGFVWDFEDPNTMPVEPQFASSPIEFFRAGLIMWQDPIFGSNDVGTTDPYFYIMTLDTSDPNNSQVDPNNPLDPAIVVLDDTFFSDPNDPNNPLPNPDVPNEPLMSVVVIPSLAPQFALGDLNCDGGVNSFDIEPFIQGLLSPATYTTQYPDCDISLGDINGDSGYNSFDIEPFIACVLNAGCP